MSVVFSGPLAPALRGEGFCLAVTSMFNEAGIQSLHPARRAASFPARSVTNRGGNDRKSRTSLLGTPPLSSRVRLRGNRRWNRSADGISPKNFE